MDQQLSGASKCSVEAEKRGKSRKEKLNRLFGSNPYVDMFYAQYTLEVDFVNEEENREYIANIIDYHYTDEKTKAKHKNNLSAAESQRYDSILTLATGMGKGWYATILSEYINSAATIPEYILNAIAFASREVVSTSLILKMVQYSLNEYKESEEFSALLKQYEEIVTEKDKEILIQDFCTKLPNDVISKFLLWVKKYEL
jgi:hypothetical protein